MSTNNPLPVNEETATLVDAAVAGLMGLALKASMHQGRPQALELIDAIGAGTARLSFTVEIDGATVQIQAIATKEAESEQLFRMSLASGPGLKGMPGAHPH